MAGIVRRLSQSLVEKREEWGGKFEFILSCIGYAVGLGTIWRFPYVCYRNGGGAFLIPYFIYMVLMGMPLVILEMGFGQLGSLSPVSIWKISPIFQGVGVGMVIISALTCIYYNVIIAWTLFYFGHSFTSELPWKTCNNSWNSPSCVQRISSSNFSGQNLSLIQNPRTASEEFWINRVLKLSKGIEEPGSLQWELVICLVVGWLLIFACLSKGIKTSGKVVYVTATLPYILLFIFIIKGLTMDGAWEGVKFYIVPDWSKLMTFQPWAEAAQQMFYSMGAAWGAWITMSSYNKFHNNFYRDAVIVSIVDTCTAFLSGFVIFSTIGYMAKQTNLKVSEVVTSGPGLVFIVMPEAISAMPFAPFWAVLFFVFIFFVGVDSQFGMFETLLSGIYDSSPTLSRNKFYFTGFLCCMSFLLGLACVTNGGMYIFQIMDWYCSTFSLMVLSILECIAISWVYGVTDFYKDMERMIGFKPTRWWGICWRFITPILIFGLLISNIIIHKPVSYGNYKYPTWAIIFGMCLSLCSLVPIPLIALYKCLQHPGNIFQKIKSASRPSPDWNSEDRIQSKKILEGQIAGMITIQEMSKLENSKLDEIGSPVL